jgi:hypothetical protein
MRIRITAWLETSKENMAWIRKELDRHVHRDGKIIFKNINNKVSCAIEVNRDWENKDIDKPSKSLTENS